ncbi:S24 family peptidase [Agrobacterium tumefaciens]|uniref:S24 family peptidase n=1 Tax=Agrobacterium tumefaciens TaxID=358 RepID=UPI0006878148|nr:S24 family peptidase [Agrobacterium tumefaciens]
MDKREWIAARCRDLKERSGFTMAQMAKAIGLSSASSWQHYQTPEKLKDEYLSRDFVIRLSNALVGKGEPKITREEIWELAGPEMKTLASRSLISSFDDQLTPAEEIDPDWDGNGAGLVDGRVHFVGEIKGSSPELSSKPGMGAGKSDDRSARLVTDGIASGHPVLNEWYVPPDYVRNALDASPNQIVILGVIGHSMTPLLNPNDRVMVDVSQNTWVGDAVYVIEELDGVMQVKTLRRASVRPLVFEVVSEADPSHPKVRNHDEIRIVGRVVGRFTRM